MRVPALTRVLTAAALAACASRDARTRESAGEVDAGPLHATASVPAATDTGRSMEHASTLAMDHSTAAAERSAARDSNHAFLRVVSDHHEGLVALVDSALPRLQGADARSDARTLRQGLDAERSRVLDVLSRTYGDSATQPVTPSGGAMLGAVLRADGPAADAAFYEQVVAHHREGVRMIDRHMPHLTGDVRRTAERMRGEHQRGIAAFGRRTEAAAPR
jgi:uncharacterized protein (DUF305 family)